MGSKKKHNKNNLAINEKRSFFQWFTDLDTNYRLAFLQTIVYGIFLITNVIMRVTESTVGPDANIIALIQSFRFLEIFVLILRLITMFLGIMQIIYGIRDKFVWGIAVGVCALVQTLPINLIATITAIAAFIISIYILIRFRK